MQTLLITFNGLNVYFYATLHLPIWGFNWLLCQVLVLNSKDHLHYNVNIDHVTKQYKCNVILYTTFVATIFGSINVIGCICELNQILFMFILPGCVALMEKIHLLVVVAVTALMVQNVEANTCKII